MKNLLISVAGLLALSIGSNAQTINIEDMTPQIGDVYTKGTSNYFSPGEAGTNQIWDLSGLIASDTYTETITDPTGLPGAVYFPDASYASVYDDESTINYYNVNNNRIETIGIYLEFGIMTLANPLTKIEFPLSFQTTYSDTYESYMDLGGFENHEIGVATVTVDGSGTLITPAGTFTDVLRLKQIVKGELTLTSNGEHYSTDSVTSTTYLFVKAGYSVPLVSLGISQFGETITENASFYIDSTVGLDKLSPFKDLTIFPVPVRSDFIVNFDLKTSAEVSFNLFSVDGRMVAQLGKDLLPAGDNTLALRLPKNISSGVYLLQIQTPESTLTKKIVVQ